MPIENSEHLITVLGRITQSTDRANGMNAFLEWMHAMGHDDVADAFVTWLNATSTIVSTTLNQTLVNQAKNRGYTSRSHHERA